MKIHLSKKIFPFLTVLFLSVSLTTNAQNNTISPYSKLGLGEIDGSGFGRNAAMGGTGLALRSNLGLNSINPASLTSLDSLAVIMETGIHGDYTQLETASQSGAKANANFSYLAMGFAASSRWFLSIGINPYSSVGYHIQTTSPVSGSTNTYLNDIEGSGGLSCAYISNAFKLSKNISVGIKTSVLFGPKKEVQYYSLTGNDNFYIYKEEYFKFSGIRFDFGYQQIFPLANKSNIVFGFNANAPGYLKNKYSIKESKVFTGSGSTTTLQDEEDVLKRVYFPANFGTGLAFNFRETFLVTADYTFDQSSQFSLEDTYSDFVDNHIFAFGTELQPKVKGFAKSFIYRGGLNYQTGYLQIDNQTLNSIGVTAGFGFQIRAIRFNLYAEHSWMGTTKNQLIKERFTRVGLNLSLMDFWFQKRKFN
ncbi:MAG: hypothetical protein A2W97_17470 [Bacteroidetes bacterium GWE2_40_63]|nr:MAG: hypothetical protein A2W96_16320 [Bacteroidetes bacterium GWD2_40_43]OFX90286.1 MAG: hypothetical protein A2W97_17470 [Bacteroidetes bacterium GWE2_40_63]